MQSPMKCFIRRTAAPSAPLDAAESDTVEVGVFRWAARQRRSLKGWLTGKDTENEAECMVMSDIVDLGLTLARAMPAV